MAVWGSQDSVGNGSVSASRRPAGSSEWQAPVSRALPGALNDLYNVGYGVDGVGDALAVYETQSGSSVDAALLDSAAPRIGSLSFPKTGRVGQRLSFSTSAVDISPVTFRWYFGDRHNAGGTGVTHVYRKAGRYAITLVATDAAGHRVTVARTSVHISPRRR